MTQIALHDLPIERFPFVVQLFRHDVELDRIEVSSPGVMDVPAVDYDVTVRFSDATGYWVQLEADGKVTRGHT
jgi:hypothetical protein